LVATRSSGMRGSVRAFVGSTNDLLSLVIPTILPRRPTMTTPFGPQLIGETEKTLNALLARYLDEPELTEPQWVTLRVASMLDGNVDAEGLAAEVRDRAHFADAIRLVDELTARELLDDGRLNTEGRELLDRLQAAI